MTDTATDPPARRGRPDIEDRILRPNVFRRTCIACGLLLFMCGSAIAQRAADLRQGNADYPVPDPAAMHALQEGAPSLLHPSSVRSLSLATSMSWTSTEPRVTAGFECAPLLLGDAVDLSSYLSGRLMRVLLRTRVSAAAVLNGSDGFHGALGLRWMLHDDADLRSDSLFQRTLAAWGRAIPELAAPCGGAGFSDNGDVMACLTEGVSGRRGMQAAIDSLRDAMKGSLWNRSVFELAVVAVYRSLGVDAATRSDALAVKQYHIHANCAFPLAGSSGQIIFGASGMTGRGDDGTPYQRQGALTVRALYGGVSERFFAETTFVAAHGLQPAFVPSLGAFLRVANGCWVQTSVGASLPGRSWISPEASLQLVFGTPEIRL
ncbi:MAG: hypothetical protein IPP94_10355 [Ignavibacteria bacterium]|nr:hypothetical protein [Ignavibacteria bacterium]